MAAVFDELLFSEMQCSGPRVTETGTVIPCFARRTVTRGAHHHGRGRELFGEWLLFPMSRCFQRWSVQDPGPSWQGEGAVRGMAAVSNEQMFPEMERSGPRVTVLRAKHGLTVPVPSPGVSTIMVEEERCSGNGCCFLMSSCFRRCSIQDPG